MAKILTTSDPREIFARKLSFNISNGNVQLIITITNKFIYVVASTYIALFDLLSEVFSACIPVTKRHTTKRLEAEDSAAALK
jgi:hypothetical protein